MGFFSLFKRKKRKKKAEQIKLEKIEAWIERKNEELKIKEKEVVKEINERMRNFISEIKIKLEKLDGLKLNEKKYEEKVKLIVEENLGKYSYHAKKLILNLEEIKETEIKGLIRSINIFFSEFQRKSAMHFEKATFLIGRELGDIDEGIKSFVRELNKFLDDNKNLLELQDSMLLITENFKELKKIEDQKKEINRNMESNKSMITALFTQIENNNISIKEIKNSDIYKKELEKKQELESSNKELEKEIYSLKEMFDFKSLANTYHSDLKKMKIISEFKENFYENFKKDGRKEIFDLLNEANINDDQISKKTERILESIRKIEEIKNFLNEQMETIKIRNLERNTGENQSKINEISSEISKSGRKIEKLNESEKEITESIKNKLSKISVELVL